MFIGNPAEPALFEKGIVSNFSRVSLRLGYSGDWVYKQRFQEEFLIDEELHSKNELSTYAGMVTLNFFRRLDLYTLLGTSKMQMDEQIFSKREYAWCVGSKLVFLKCKNLFFGADVKYFETDQRPQYFVIDGAPYNVVNNYTSKYFDAQAAVGFAYRISLFVPYINATYIYTHIASAATLLRFPDANEITNYDLPSLICRKPWGMALGFSLIDCAKASLAFEWRLINQNGVNVNGEIRF